MFNFGMHISLIGSEKKSGGSLGCCHSKSASNGVGMVFHFQVLCATTGECNSNTFVFEISGVCERCI